MPITDNKITTFQNLIAELEDRPDLGSTLALKQYFDSSPEELRAALSGLIDDLLSNVAGDSGARNIGSESIVGVSGNTVYDQLVSLKQVLDGVSVGQIPDGTITSQKLESSLVNKINAAAASTDVSKLTGLIDRNYFDDYQLWMELYYKGTIGQVNTSGVKALSFDGLLDNSQLDLGPTTAYLDYTKHLAVPVGGVTSWNTPTSTSYYAGTSTRAVEFKLSADVAVFKISIQDRSGGAWTLTNKDTGTVIASGNAPYMNLESPIKLSANVNYRYEQASIPDPYAPSSLTTTADGVTLTLAAGSTYSLYVSAYKNAASKDVVSKTRSLSFTSTRAKVYITAKNSGSANIVPTFSFDGGTTYVSGSLISSRQDTKFTDYTEYEYEFAGSGTSGKLKITQNPADAFNLTVLKRYGIHYL